MEITYVEAGLLYVLGVGIMVFFVTLTVLFTKSLVKGTLYETLSISKTYEKLTSFSVDRFYVLQLVANYFGKERWYKIESSRLRDPNLVVIPLEKIPDKFKVVRIEARFPEFPKEKDHAWVYILYPEK